MKRLGAILLVAFCLLLSSVQAQVTIGCKASATPCNNNGICTKDSICLCNRYYSGDACENGINYLNCIGNLIVFIVVSDDKKVSFVEGGISQGALAGIIVGWILGTFAIIAILVILWINKDTITGDSNFNEPTPTIRTPEKKTERIQNKVSKYLKA